MFTKTTRECRADAHRRALEQSLIEFLNDEQAGEDMPSLPALDDAV